MKKRTKAKKQKLNNLLVLLVLAAVLLIMSTYAWFTANRTVNIDKIDVHVATSSGLQISANGIDWKTVIDSNDLKKASEDHNPTTLTGGYKNAKNQMSQENAPVSTSLSQKASNKDHLAMFYGIVNADMDADSDTYGKYMLTTELQDDKDYHTDSKDANVGHYVAFDIFLKSGDPEEKLYLTGSVYEKNGLDTDGSVVTTAQEKGIANAARVAIVEGGHTTSDDSDSNIQALSTQGKVYLWEPNADAHTEHGLINARDLGWNVPTVSGTASDYQPYTMVTSYDGVAANIDDPIELSQATYEKDKNHFALITPNWQTKKGEVKNMVMPKYSGGSREGTAGDKAIQAGVTKYRIYMWVEGQDIDCENYASGTYLQYNLGFTLDESTGYDVYNFQT